MSDSIIVRACEGNLQFWDDGENLHVHSGHVGQHCIPPDQRRALLSHLLQAEGLPGVEEIEMLRRDFYNAESTIDKLMADLAESRKLHQDMCAEVESLSKLIFDARQARLTELLEEQARERVHAIPFGENVRFENSAGHGVSLTHRKGVYGFCLPGFETDQKHAEAIFWGLAAALAEKRRRESEVVDG